MINRPLAVAAIILLAACAQDIPVQTTYTGGVAASGGGEPVALVLDFRDQNGTPFQADSLVVGQYRAIAEDALRQAGFTPDPAAELTVQVALAGRTLNGIMHSESSTARNVALSVVTAGIACSEMIHTADAVGEVRVGRGGSTIAARDIDMRRTGRSCHTTLNPNWAANHQTAAVATYGEAVEAHVAAWLPLLPQGS